MQNRLDAAKESQATQIARLKEVRDAIEVEKAARPDSVSDRFYCGNNSRKLGFRRKSEPRL
jgi:hypothetical protein